MKKKLNHTEMIFITKNVSKFKHNLNRKSCTIKRFEMKFTNKNIYININNEEPS